MRSYKKYIYLYLPVSLITILITLAAFIYSFNTSEDLIWIRELKIKKDSYTFAERQNKIVINAGSNALFGINTKRMTEQLGIPSYNLAIHAGLGLDFILEESKDHLQSGDTVILPIEYELMSIDFFSIRTKLAYDYYRLYEHDKVTRVSPQERWQFLRQNNLAEAFTQTITARLKKRSELGYKSSNINSHGDQINHAEAKQELIHNIKPIDIPTQPIETIGLRKIAAFSKWCEDNHITMYFTFPNLMYFPEYEKDPYKKYFDFLDRYFAEHRIHVLLHPYESMYEQSLFYDTYYHMTDEGMSVRTDDLIDALKLTMTR